MMNFRYEATMGQSSEWLNVRCGTCGYEWMMDTKDADGS